jgi:hypothetical protein
MPGVTPTTHPGILWARARHTMGVKGILWQYFMNKYIVLATTIGGSCSCYCKKSIALTEKTVRMFPGTVRAYSNTVHAAPAAAPMHGRAGPDGRRRCPSADAACCLRTKAAGGGCAAGFPQRPPCT